MKISLLDRFTGVSKKVKEELEKINSMAERKQMKPEAS
jgi:hypothetical protein